jgi:hypothetical protein
VRAKAEKQIPCGNDSKKNKCGSVSREGR